MTVWHLYETMYNITIKVMAMVPTINRRVYLHYTIKLSLHYEFLRLRWVIKCKTVCVEYT